MKIAVTYEDGKVFQHFGKTETFKVYEVEAGQLESATLLSANGAGHEALADLLAENKVDVLICGGLGDGAKSALEEAGIEVVSGATGGVDAAVVSWLKGELVSSGVNCDHHHDDEEEGGCGEHECGGHCGGCGGCHHGPVISGKNVEKTCRVHYKGTFNDGTQFDSSYDRGEPLEFVCGVGMMIPGFDQAVANMEVGEIQNIHLMPEDAYGPADPSAVFDAEIAQLPGSEGLEIGQQVYLSNNMGQQFPVVVAAKTETTITFDANHPMAGKELNFTIELVEVKE